MSSKNLAKLFTLIAGMYDDGENVTTAIIDPVKGRATKKKTTYTREEVAFFLRTLANFLESGVDVMGILKTYSDEKSTEKPQKRIYRKRDEIIVEEKKKPKKSARIETKVVRVSSSSTIRYNICSACKKAIESKHKGKRKCPYCGIAWEKEQI